jgi:transcriptional regulator with XRE-family HTH domain
MRAAEILRVARRRSGLSSRALARRAGTSHATLLAYEARRKTPRVDTLERILRAAGFDADIDLAPRPDAHDAEREAKGRELAEALELAAQFPTRHDEGLQFPRFGRAA